MRWFGLALLGLLIAAAVSIAASRLASQQIGLASEPVTAGDALAPAAPKKRTIHRSQNQPTGRGKANGPSTHEPAEPVEPAPEYTEPEPEPAPAEPQPGAGSHDGAGDGGADD